MAIPIVMQDCIAATGATIVNKTIYAVNGIDCNLRNITCNCSVCVRRPYGFISSNCNCILATEGTCSNKIYILDLCFNEIGSICIRNGEGPLLTAYATDCGRLILTYRNVVILADCNGNTASVIGCTQKEGSEFISAFPFNHGILLALNNDDETVLQTRENCNVVQSCILPKGISVRSFTQGCDGTVYGLFSKGYPYRYLIPIIVDGILSCPTGNCFGISLCRRR